MDLENSFVIKDVTTKHIPGADILTAEFKLDNKVILFSNILRHKRRYHIISIYEKERKNC